MDPSTNDEIPSDPANDDFGNAFASGRADNETNSGEVLDSNKSENNLVGAKEESTEKPPSSDKQEETGKKEEESPKESSPGPSNLPQTLFYVKQFESTPKSQSIILQSVNGPCPLIAIVNCLLLQHKLELPADIECITATSLCSLLGNYLLDRAQQNTQEKHHTEQYILDSLDRFVQIQTGIDVNVKFNSVEGFEYTPELSLFDLAQVSLVHGWVVDPQDTILSELVADLSYNQLVEKTMEKSCSVDTKEVSESLLLRDLLESTQLTVHGICEINSSMKTGDIVVLFRNNHFSTITKQQDRLFVLVTDIGWAEQPKVIWETLDSTCNSSAFVDGFFKPSKTSQTSQETRPTTNKDEVVRNCYKVTN